MVATPDWKLAINRAGEVYMLHDLNADPVEARNLAGLPEYEEVTESLLPRLRRRMSEGPCARPQRPHGGE